MDRLKKICKRKINTSSAAMLSKILIWKDAIEAAGGSLLFEEKFSLKIIWHEQELKIKINAFDGEFYVFITGDNNVKYFVSFYELRDWFNKNYLSNHQSTHKRY